MTIARTGIAEMAAYQLADLSPPEGKELISLSQNECFRLPSPLALGAAKTAVAGTMLYPDPDWRELREAIAQAHAIPFEGILCGNGSLDLIGALARVYAGPERAVLVPAHAYPFFSTAAKLVEARFDTAPETGLHVDVAALLDNVWPDTGIVFIANPGNPTGTRIPKADLLRLRAGLREDILLVIDEAYGEYADHLGESCFDMAAGGNTVVLRTFSKAYGMAGFRVGWGLFPPAIAGELRKVLNPNNISSPAQAAAKAAIGDQAYMRETCALTADVRKTALDVLQAGGFAVQDSFTNFLLINFGSQTDAAATDAFLRSEGIFLRTQGGVGLPHMLRMTIGPQEQVELAVRQLIQRKERSV